MRRDGPGPTDVPAADAADVGAAVASTDGADAVVASQQTRQALGELDRAAGAVAAIDPALLTEGCMREVLRTVADVEGRLKGISARVVAAAERAGLPDRDGAASTTRWVADTTNRSTRSAADTARLAQTVERSPQVADALAAGEIGPDQASSISRRLDEGVLDEGDADELLREAKVLPPNAFDRETKRLRDRRDQRERRRSEQVARDRRRHRHWRLTDGSLQYEGVLPPAEGDTFEAAFDGMFTPDGADVPDEARRTRDQVAADTIVELAELALRSDQLPTNGGAPRQVLVHVPVAALNATLTEAEEAGAGGQSDHGTNYSAAAARTALCDSTVRRIVVAPDGMVLDVGRATRQWSPQQRAAIIAMDGGCRCPDCTIAASRCVIHHITWWRDGGTTDIGNGLLLCNRGHALVHDDGWTVEMDPGTRAVVWTSPGGRQHTTRPYGPAMTDRDLSAGGPETDPARRVVRAEDPDDVLLAPATHDLPSDGSERGDRPPRANAPPTQLQLGS